MPFQVIERAFGGRDDFDVESFKKRSGAEVVVPKTRADMIIVGVGGVGSECLGKPEYLLERMVEPKPRRRSSEEIVVFREQAPDLPAVFLGGSAICTRHPQGLKRHALRMKHAEHVVIGRDEEIGRVWKMGILREPTRVRVTMGRNDRRGFDGFIERARNVACSCLCWKQPVGVKERHGQRLPLLLCLPRWTIATQIR